MTKEQEMKTKAERILLDRMSGGVRKMLADVDERLLIYFEGLADDPEAHNLYELLGAVKFLRLLVSYPFDVKKVQKAVRLREGEWRKDNGTWRHVSGGIKCPGTSRPTVYRWEPFQVFILASVFGFKAWVDTELTTADRQTLLDTERVENGKIMDLRRLCTNFTFYAPRKTDKTGLSAYLQVWFFLMEDWNAEIYCCSNSSDQSKLLFRRSKSMIQQLDDGHRIRATETVCDWRSAFKSVRDSSIRPLSAGGKTKDGMFAQLCCRDEYGSAGYVNGKSDMKMLVDVIDSSMGPRREPLDFTTTTAGRVQQGPFVDFLDGLHRLLEREIAYSEGSEIPTLTGDRMLCLCLEPDLWERDEETLLTSRDVRRKINPMLGKIVQHQFYDDEIEKARLTGDTSEVITKLLNVYQSNKMTEWFSAEEIRAIQSDKRIDDCVDQKGWIVYAGLDFSKGDDLNGVSYLALNTETGEFFGDMDSYMSEEAVNNSPLRELFKKWGDEGWLHIVPGKTFDPAWPVDRIIQLHNKGVNFISFGYDPYNAKIVMNALSQWVFDLGLEPKDIIVPVRQNFATYNPAVNEFDYMVKRADLLPNGVMMPDPMIHLSRNPMWPWQFSNCVLMESSDGMENRKPVKGGSASGKVDNVQMLLSALICYDMSEGTINK